MPDIITENYLNCFVFFFGDKESHKGWTRPSLISFSAKVLNWNWTRTGAYQEALFRLSAGVIFPPVKLAVLLNILVRVLITGKIFLIYIA